MSSNLSTPSKVKSFGTTSAPLEFIASITTVKFAFFIASQSTYGKLIILFK